MTITTLAFLLGILVGIFIGIFVALIVFVVRFKKYNNYENGKPEQLPNMTLKQAIEKAKPNMDKIKDVDKFLDYIR